MLAPLWVYFVIESPAFFFQSGGAQGCARAGRVGPPRLGRGLPDGGVVGVAAVAAGTARVPRVVPLGGRKSGCGSAQKMHFCTLGQ